MSLAFLLRFAIVATSQRICGLLAQEDALGNLLNGIGTTLANRYVTNVMNAAS